MVHTMTDRGRASVASRAGRVVLGAALTAAAVSGCGTSGPTIVACNAFSLPDAVSGTLRIAPDGTRTAWIEATDGRRMSITWPAGFAVGVSPVPTLYDRAGRRIASEGDVIKLGQTLPDSAAGTPDDPYVPDACDVVYP